MADEKLVALLRQGVAEWNAWHKDIDDEYTIDLCEADLHGANLVQACLIGANLIGANLRKTLAWEANFNSADLSGANLQEAELNGTNFGGAILSEANLQEAKLNGADLRYAELSRANLQKALLRDTVFADVDLSTVTGLETCIHQGPSIIDHRTLQRSGRSPLAFLRGVGLPESFIEYLPSLLNQPIQMY